MNYVTRLMANGRMHLTGAVDDAMKVELFNAVDEFCRQTNAWHETIQVQIVAGTNLVYDIVPTYGTILRLMQVYPYGSRVPNTQAHMRVPGELHFWHDMTIGDIYDVVVSLAPIDPTEAGTAFPVIDDWVWERFFDAFIDGLIMKMASQPDKPYTNAQLVQYHGRRFRNAISTARADLEKHNMADGQAWQFPFFAGRRRR